MRAVIDIGIRDCPGVAIDKIMDVKLIHFLLFSFFRFVSGLFVPLHTLILQDGMLQEFIIDNKIMQENKQ